jgi:hypothetical protein
MLDSFAPHSRVFFVVFARSNNDVLRSLLAASLLLIDNASSALVRTTKFLNNDFGTESPASRIVTLSGGSFQRFVGNAFYDAPPTVVGGVARSIDLFVSGVTSATIKQNGVAVFGRPTDAALVVRDSRDVSITQNALFAPVRFENINAASGTPMNIEFAYNTVSVADDMKVGKPLIVLAASAAHKLTGLTIENSLLVECGDQVYLCANMTCGTPPSAVDMVVVRNNTVSDSPSCNGNAVGTGVVLSNNHVESEPQSYALDQSTGCNGLSQVLGSQTNFQQLPFVNWYSWLYELFASQTHRPHAARTKRPCVANHRLCHCFRFPIRQSRQQWHQHLR